MIGESLRERARARLAVKRGNVGDVWVFAAGLALALAAAWWMGRG